ncbi:metallophosphoesterase [Natronococcus occultus]|uniref:Putative phosphoesterase, ICC n=1 Tax=Natronococcus occultus SP4 TaxID=694430 RepID=L0JX60_9EURY|nr:metallophosphoesterase [Natronococcus occultus]AGB36443.1 putative phosphoesterase, ICC [Natronococcus occultus SP4]
MTDAVDVPFELDDRAVYFPRAETLVLADVHLGRAASSPVEAPLGEATDVAERLEALLAARNPETVVIAGDLLHSFSRIPRGVERSLAELVDRVEDAGASLAVTPGNHDAMLASAFDGETASSYRLADEETVVCHGHERPSGATTGTSRYVLGHEHPAIEIDGRKRPCFLYAPPTADRAGVLVLPAFTRLADGRTINRLRSTDLHSPLIENLEDCYPAVYDDSSGEALWFPPLGESRRFLD